MLLLLLLLLALGYFSIGLGGLRGLRLLRLAVPLVLLCSGLLVICCLIQRRSRTEGPAKPRTINELSHLCQFEDRRIQTNQKKNPTGNAVGSPSVWAPESALRRSLRLAGLLHAVLCLSGVTLKEMKQAKCQTRPPQKSSSTFKGFKIEKSFKTHSQFLLPLRPLPPFQLTS